MDDNWTDPGYIDPVALRNTMGAFPTGVTVITTTTEGTTPVGLTVSSFTSVSLKPPLLLVCVARTAGSLPAFRVGKHMAVNVLGRDQESVARLFAGRSEDRFAGLDYSSSANGSPLLAGTSAWVSGFVERIYDAGDHVILLTHIEEMQRNDKSPLLYHSGTMHDWNEAALTYEI